MEPRGQFMKAEECHKRTQKSTKTASFPDFFVLWTLHCYPSISLILAKIFGAALTQRRKDAKGEMHGNLGFASESLRLSVFASLR